MGIGTTTWGSAVGTGGNNGLRLGYRIDRTYPSDAEARLRLRVWAWTRSSVSDSNNSFNLSGNWSNRSGQSRNINHPTVYPHWPTNNRTLLYDELLYVSRQYGSSVSRSFSASFSGIEAAPGTARVSGSVSVAARPYLSPNNPSGVSASRSSDTRIVVSYSHSATTARPRTRFRIRRRELQSNGSWSSWIDRGTSTSLSFTDTTTSNRRYQYQVRAEGPGGNSSYVTATSTVDTSPSAPSNMRARAVSAGIEVSWNNTSRYPTSVRIERQEDDGSWQHFATVSAGTTSRVLNDPDLTKTHRFRARAEGPSLNSGWVYSERVELAAPPGAPTNLGPSTVWDATQPRELTWRPAPTDGSEQTAFEVRHRLYDPASPGSWTWTGKINSSTSRWTLPADTYANGDVIEWQVATWGVHPDRGPYSASNLQTPTAPPTVSINAPDSETVVEQSTALLEWGYSQDQDHPQIAWRVTLTRAGGQSQVITGEGADTEYLLTGLRDDSAYTVVLQVQSATGQWSDPDTVGFPVAYPQPQAPSLDSGWTRETGAVSLQVEQPVWEEGYAEADHHQIWGTSDDAAAEAYRNWQTLERAADEHGLADLTTVTNVVTNPRGRHSEATFPIRENLIENPRGRHPYQSAPTTTVYENLVTNPRGRNTSGTVTIRENLVDSGPRLTTSTRKSLISSTVAWGGWDDSHGAAIRTASTGGTSSRAGFFITGMQGDSGHQITVSLDAAQAPGKNYRLRILLLEGTSSQVESGYADLTDERERYVFHLDPTGSWDRLYIDIIDIQGAIAPEIVGYVDRLCVENGFTEGDYFDGDTWDGDPDFTPEWTGTPGESTSRLVAPKPVGWVAPMGTVFYSQTYDAVGMILEPLDEGEYENGVLATALGPGTDLGEHTSVFQLWTDTGNTVYVQDGVELSSGGTYRHPGSPHQSFAFRLIAAAKEDAPVNILYLWAGAVPGEYTGPYFDGHTSDWDGDPDLTPQWSGDEDDSVSELVAPRPDRWVDTLTPGIVYYSHTRDALAVKLEHVANIDRMGAVLFTAFEAIEEFPEGTDFNVVVSFIGSDTGEAVEFLDPDDEPVAILEPGEETIVPLGTLGDSPVVYVVPVRVPGTEVSVAYFRAGASRDEIGPVLPYFDGHSNPAEVVDDPDFDLIWTGEEDQSASEISAPLPAEWQAASAGFYYSRTYDALAMRPILSEDGRRIAYAVPPFETGERRRSIVQFWTDTGAPMDVMSTALGIDRQQGIPSGGTFVGEALNTVNRLVYFIGHEPVNVVYFRNLISDEPDYVGPFFDGHTDRDGFHYEWEGLPDQSPSTVTMPERWEAADTFERLWFDTRVLIIDGLEVGGAFSYPVPAVGDGTGNVYQAVTVSALPSIAESAFHYVQINSDTRVDCPPRRADGETGEFYLNGGEDYSLVCRAVYGLEVDEGFEKPDTVRHRFSGRALPVAFYGDGEEFTLKVAFTTLPGEEYRGEHAATYRQWRGLVARRGPHLYRDWLGRRYFVDVEEFNGARQPGDHMAVTMRLTRVEDEEP